MKLLALTIGGNGGPTYTINVPALGDLPSLSLQRLITFGVLFLLTVAILLAFFFVLFGGLKWILSQGDKKQLENAQKTIQYALVGLVLVLVSFFIINLIAFLFQVPLLGK